MLKSKVQADLKVAMKAGATADRDAIRLLLAELMAAEKADGNELTDEAGAAVVSRLIKRTNNSLEEYRKLGAADTVAKLEHELSVYKRYAPEELSEEAVKAIVDEAVKVSGASSPQDMGKVMRLVMPRVQGKADGAMVNRLVKERLNP